MREMGIKKIILKILEIKKQDKADEAHLLISTWTRLRAEFLRLKIGQENFRIEHTQRKG